jgi:hypothetical protein
MSRIPNTAFFLCLQSPLYRFCELLSLVYVLGLPDSVNAGERLDDSALPVGHVTDRPNIDRRLSTDHLHS